MVLRVIGFIIMLLSSCFSFGQSDSVDIKPYDFIIKTDGVLKHVSATGFKAITTVISLQDGRLIKPEGIIILDSGKELVMKNGEYIDQNGNIHTAPDSLIKLVAIRYYQILNIEYQKELRQYKDLNALLYQKNELLQALHECLGRMKYFEKKSSTYNKLRVKVEQLSVKISLVDSEIQILENALKSHIIVRPAYF
jgi:hypothetical protein